MQNKINENTAGEGVGGSEGVWKGLIRAPNSDHREFLDLIPMKMDSSQLQPQARRCPFHTNSRGPHREQHYYHSSTPLGS